MNRSLPLFTVEHGAGSSGRVITALRGILGTVAVVAGTAGIVMLVAPRSTDRYFAWGLGPPAAAALVGGFYVASAVVFGYAALRETWTGMRGLCFAALALTFPTLVSTIRHRQVFDFSRWLAVAWLVLFVASPLVFGSELWVQRRAPIDVGSPLRAWARGALTFLAALYGALALTLWFAPGTASGHGPFPVAGMGARFLGCWAAFLATLAVYACVCADWKAARTPLLGLTLWPLAALLAAAVHADDLRSGGRSTAYVGILVIVAAIAAAMVFETRRR